MNTPLRIFTWGVPSGGFSWMDLPEIAAAEPARNGRYLLPNWDRLGRLNETAPLDESPALFWHFASLPQPLTEQSVLEFANRHGWLGLRRQLVWLEVPLLGHSVFMPVERMEDWEAEVVELSTCIEAWQATREGDVETLRRFVRIIDFEDGARGYWAPANQEPAADFPTSGGRPSRPLAELGGWRRISRLEQTAASAFDFMKYERFDVLVPTDSLADLAMRHVRSSVGVRLKAETASVLTSEPDGQSRLEVRPENLLGALWLQFALAIDGERVYGQCPVCGERFEIAVDSAYSPNAKGVHRSNRRYCSDSCKTKAYRTRKATAREMARAGRKTAEIAAALESSAETVAGWLEGSK